MSPNATSRQLHVSLAENHRCDPVVRLRITSGLPVIRPQSLAGDGELRAAGLTRPVIALNPDLRMRVVSTPGMHF
jgi:hypothetical protein